MRLVGIVEPSMLRSGSVMLASLPRRSSDTGTGSPPRYANSSNIWAAAGAVSRSCSTARVTNAATVTG